MEKFFRFVQFTVVLSNKSSNHVDLSGFSPLSTLSLMSDLHISSYAFGLCTISETSRSEKESFTLCL